MMPERLPRLAFQPSQIKNRELLFTPRLWNTYSTNRKLTVNRRERLCLSAVLQLKLPHFGVVERRNALYYVVVIILFFSVSCCCVLFFNVFASGGRGLPVDFTLQRYMFFSIRRRKKATLPAGLTFGGRISVGCRSAGDAPKAGNSCCSTTCLMIAFMSRVSDTHFTSSRQPHTAKAPRLLVWGY